MVSQLKNTPGVKHFNARRNVENPDFTSFMHRDHLPAFLHPDTPNNSHLVMGFKA